MNHPTEIKYEGDLVEDIGNLRYDALKDFFAKLSEKLARDAAADEDRKRPQLADLLRAASDDLTWAAEAIDQAWKISEPHEHPVPISSDSTPTPEGGPES